MHRLESFRQLGWQTIPANIKDADPLIEELIEVEENLVSSRLSAIDEARFMVRWEEILTALGRRARQGDNRWIRSGLTNEELEKNRGMSKRSYQYTKSIAKLHPEVQDILNETEFANSKMDMVALAKENDEVQLEVAFLLSTGKYTLQITPFHTAEPTADMKPWHPSIGRALTTMQPHAERGFY